MILNPDFLLEHVIFTVEDFFKLLNSGTLKRGDVVVWEEMGIAVDARTFMGLQNRCVSYVMEGFRFKNLGVIMNLPGLGMVDINVRKLSHQYFETRSINRKNKTCRCSVFDLQYNPRLDRIYAKHPIVYIKGHPVMVEHLNIPKPPDKIVKPYKKIKAEYIDKLNIDLEKQIEESKKDKTSKPKDVTGILEDVLGKQDEYSDDLIETLKDGKLKVDHELLSGLYDVGLPTARKAKKLLEYELNKEIQ